MSATSAPFGLRPAYHPSGLDRAQGLANIISSGFGSNILKGQAVKLVAATGYIDVAAAGDPLYGVFDGVDLFARSKPSPSVFRSLCPELSAPCSSSIRSIIAWVASIGF